MITITVNSENGADARKELMELLGLVNAGTLTATIGGSKDPAILLVTERPDTIIGDGVHSAAELVQEHPAAEEPKKKRRTKAEIEAETLAANTGTEEPPASEAEVVKEETVEFPALVDLQRVCAILVRAGYKDKGIELIKTIGGADSSKDVAEAKRADVIAAMTAFAEEKKIAL